MLYQCYLPYAERKLRFPMRVRSTTDQLFFIRQILEKWPSLLSYGTYHLFIDFKTAYDDSIHFKNTCQVGCRRWRHKEAQI